MDEYAKLLTAFATVLWPLIFLYLLLKFSEPLARVIESTRTRKFALKVAGNELTVEEASEQQVRLLSDLQSKVARLEAALSAGSMPAGRAPAGAAPETQGAAPPAEEAPAETSRVLWVDDAPKNNSYIVALLNEQGLQVDLARSTDEALRQFRARRYDAIVTDMERPEGERAGIELTRRIRAIDRQVPVYFFTGSWAARNLIEEAKAAGGSGITSSSSTLIASLLGTRRGR